MAYMYEKCGSGCLKRPKIDCDNEIPHGFPSPVYARTCLETRLHLRLRAEHLAPPALPAAFTVRESAAALIVRLPCPPATQACAVLRDAQLIRPPPEVCPAVVRCGWWCRCHGWCRGWRSCGCRCHWARTWVDRACLCVGPAGTVSTGAETVAPRGADAVHVSARP